MLIRQILATLLLLSLSIGTSPFASILLSGDNDSGQHSSDQPLTDGEEENEKSKSECDELEVLFCGLLTARIEQLTSWSSLRFDGPNCFSQPLLTGPDHSRAPPARA